MTVGVAKAPRPPCPGLCHALWPGTNQHTLGCREAREREAQAARQEQAESEGHRLQRISRDEYGLALAQAAALRADCTRRQVGAVIVAQDGSIVSTGYNGLASGKPGCASAGACARGQLTREQMPSYEDGNHDYTNCRAVHAEVNAIIRAGRDRCVGATIYVTVEPCFNCSVVIEGAGLARTVVPERTRLGHVPKEIRT